jgi:hypothetical protein
LPDLPDLPDQPNLQDQQEGPDQHLLWPLPHLLSLKALFLSLELWGDAQTEDINHFKLKQNDKNKTYSTKPSILSEKKTPIFCV